MELKEFVTKTLVQIVEGIQEAKQQAEDWGAQINPKYASTRGHKIQEVDFDVAIMASDESEKTGGLRVAGILRGGLGTTSKESSVSRVKFTVPVVLPTKRLTAEERRTAKLNE